MEIALATRCRATKIIMTSGFIGDPEAHGYQPDLYTKGKGMIIQYRFSTHSSFRPKFWVVDITRELLPQGAH